jgi:Ca-activated chloride channel family protein
MRMLRPEYLRWALVLPVLAAAWAAHAYYRRAPRASDILVFVASLTAGGALLAALVRPQVLLAQRIPEVERQDLVVLLDRSASMHATDIEPSRLERATLELRTLLREKPDGIDRVGLVGFADAALILSYLTRDADSLLFYLDWIDRERQTLLGTDIGAALASGREVVRKDTRPSNKVFLLVSDGEDYGATLARELATFREAGLRVHCVGVGGEAPQPVPLLDAAGPARVLRDESGAVVTTTFSETTLRQVATATGGRFVRSRSGRELAAAIAHLVRGERRIVGWRTASEYHDLYPAALAVAAVAAALLWVRL